MSRTKRHKLGQHFLTDESVVMDIVDAAGVGQGDRVVEIGPGRGILTRELLATGASVTAVELDAGLHRHLSVEFADEDRLTLIRANAMRHDFAELDTPFHLVSNLPYSVSVPLIERFVEMGVAVTKMTIMVQAEVGRRLCADAGQTGYGSLSVFLDYYCERSYLFTVPPEAFRPAPKVDSAVLSLRPRTDEVVRVADEGKFFEFVRVAFVHRRKTLKNNIAMLWPDIASFQAACDSAEIEPRIRPEQVTLKEFATLYKTCPSTEPFVAK